MECEEGKTTTRKEGPRRNCEGRRYAERRYALRRSTRSRRKERSHGRQDEMSAKRSWRGETRGDGGDVVKGKRDVSEQGKDCTRTARRFLSLDVTPSSTIFFVHACTACDAPFDAPSCAHRECAQRAASRAARRHTKVLEGKHCKELYAEPSMRLTPRSEGATIAAPGVPATTPAQASRNG